MRRVMFVDDAPEILQHLRRALAPMQSEWEMQFFASAAAALPAIRETPCDVVVSDMTMPVMDGAQFLSEVRRLSPQTIRIVCGESLRTSLRNCAPSITGMVMSDTTTSQGVSRMAGNAAAADAKNCISHSDCMGAKARRRCCRISGASSTNITRRITRSFRKQPLMSSSVNRGLILRGRRRRARGIESRERQSTRLSQRAQASFGQDPN